MGGEAVAAAPGQQGQLRIGGLPPWMLSHLNAWGRKRVNCQSSCSCINHRIYQLSCYGYVCLPPYPYMYMICKKRADREECWCTYLRSCIILLHVSHKYRLTQHACLVTNQLPYHGCLALINYGKLGCMMICIYNIFIYQKPNGWMNNPQVQGGEVSHRSLRPAACNIGIPLTCMEELEVQPAITPQTCNYPYL
jgi:hypothetical protein